MPGRSVLMYRIDPIISRFLLIFLLSGLLQTQIAKGQTQVNIAAAQTAVHPDSSEITLEQMAGQSNYDQPQRPQFHFTTLQGHIGDATGLVRYRGEYHLFNIYDEWSRKTAEHKRWGHAVSTDLIHWTQMPPILDTLVDHSPGSGSSVVDWNNSSGLRTGAEKTIVTFYTDYKRGSCIIYSNDRGRHWIRYSGNPAIPGTDDIRDPNVFWYASANGWRMVRYERKGFAFYASNDLKHWTWLSRIDGYYECPDLFKLPVLGENSESRWVLIDGDGSYVLGEFDGSRFVPLTGKLKVDYGPALYATQTWKLPPEDGAAYQMAWMRYPLQTALTWDGQMSFPVKLTLQKFPDGIRLCREPIGNIYSLDISRQTQQNLSVKQGQEIVLDSNVDLLDITLNVDIANASEFDVRAHGQTIKYSAVAQTLSVGESVAPLRLIAGHLRLRILIDRSSVEVFADRGEVTISLVTLDASDRKIILFSGGGDVNINSFEANRLESIWLDHDNKK